MPATARAIRVEAEDGVVLHCLEWTSISSSRATAPVIALHGGGANAHWWDHLAAQIAIQRPVYALDFRGHGDSDYPEERRLGAFNDDLEALLGWLCREDVFLFGHSMGAAVALDHASRFGATRGIALVDLARGSGRGSRRRARLALSLRRSYRTRSEAALEFSSQLRACRFVEIPEAGHHVLIDQPEALLSALEDFMDERPQNP
jgi:pimeloyl-ACP methyl ester carboxylesterase